jgi:hypothetical protein
VGAGGRHHLGDATEGDPLGASRAFAFSRALVAYTSKHTSAGAEVSPDYLRGPWQKDSNCSKPTWSGAA